MPQRLPTLGESPYKTILDGFLTVVHNSDGSLKSNPATSIVIGTATGSTIAINALSSATSAPAIVGQATAYYAGLFFNVTDAGGDVANANQVGLVGQSAYSNAMYAQQGAISGTGSTLARNNIYPALYATRVISSLNGFDFTAPVFRIDETTAATGGLMDVKKSGGTVVFTMDKNGAIAVKPSSGIGITVDRGIQFNASVSATVAGPGVGVSSNTLRFSCGTNGMIFVSQDNGTALMSMTNAGALTLSTYGTGGAVTVGAADSGGAGFKVLRVPN